MAKRLSARTVATAGPGKHADGDGLYLSVTKDGSGERRRWLLYFTWGGRRREMGLGSAREVSLAKAREAAEAARAMVRAGIDPIAERNREPVRKPTFGEAADAYLAAMKPQFRNEKHVAQWEMTLTHYAAPIRAKLVSEIGTEDVLDVLKPLWATRPETASRLRGRIERVLDAATAQGHRTGDNPARWRGHLATLLPRRGVLTRGHHAAMPFPQVPEFFRRLSQSEAIAARALEFTILTATRSGEVRGAVWSEIDMENRQWVVPAHRMKAGREHRIPLSSPAVAILQGVSLLADRPGNFVFPGQRPGRPLSVMAMDMLLRRTGSDVTVHGFRSAFRDWCGETTDFPREIAEAALAHVVGDKTERAYRRGDALEKRRRLMEAWARFLTAP